MTELSERFSFDAAAKKIYVSVGKVEIGQHIHSAFQTLVADTLEIDTAHVIVLPVSTDLSPDDGLTVGSLSIQVTGASVRASAESLRDRLFKEASLRLNANADDIALDSSSLEFCARGNCCSIFDLPLATTLRSKNGIDGNNRSTISSSIYGERIYIQDLVLPDMIHARALRGREINLSSNDNAHVISDGGFTALVANTEKDLDQAWAHITSNSPPRDSGCDGPVSDWIKNRRVSTQDSGDTNSIEASVIQTASRAFILHASIAPSCAMARLKDNVLEIWTHSQGIFPLRDAIAKHVGLDLSNVIVHHVPSAGCYGHNAADDAVMDAVLVCLQHKGIPVRVAWTREDEFQHAPVGTAMQIEIQAELGRDHSIKKWRHIIRGGPHGQRPGSGGHVNLIAAIEQKPECKADNIQDLPEAIGGGATRNAIPPYAIETIGITSHLVQDLPVRTSSLRGLGAQMNVVCIEATMDKLANRCAIDPLDYRLQQIKDPRGHDALHRLGSILKSVSASRESEAIGIGYSRYKEKAAYAAVAARVHLADKVELVDVWAVVDAGRIVDMSGALNQIEGGIIQAASWTLYEGALLRSGYIDAAGWDEYPIMSWANIPTIKVTVVDTNPELPSLGIGECMVGPVSAAIVNALFKITGYSIADLPLTRENIIKAIAAAE